MKDRVNFSCGSAFCFKSFKLHHLILLFTAIIFSSWLQAQGTASLALMNPAPDFVTDQGENAFLPDSLQLPRKKPNLLPHNISFIENAIWGENGLVREVGLASPLTIEVRKHELSVRRTMLTAHQIGGFTTLGLMIGTCYYGQKIIDGGVNGRRDYESAKNTFVAATLTSYAITAALAILSPPPLIRRDEVSTTSIHKTLAWFHIAGMIATPILGSLIYSNRMFHSDKAHVHQVAGYITTAIFATSMIVITF